MQRDFWLRPTVVVCVATLGLLFGQGCKDNGGNESADTGDGDGDNETGETAGDGDGDSEVVPWDFSPIYGAPNLDDDDANGTRDWQQTVFDGDDEVGTLVIPGNTYLPGETIRLTLSGELTGVRFWYEGAHILGSGVGDPLPSYEITGASGDIELPWVFGEFYNVADLLIERVDGGNVVASTTIHTVSSPLIMNHHLQPAEHFWIVQTNDNANFVADYQAVLGDDLTLVPGAPYQHDRWIQDEIEYAFSTAPTGLRLDSVIDSIRDRGLDNFPEDFFGDMAGWYIGTWGNPINATSFDSFGNLDASPPVDGYPFGRIYYGREGTDGMDLVLGDFLAEQTLQAPFQVDSAWLCVGHVDEFSSFVPDSTSPKGFKMLLSSTTAAYELFESLDSSWDLGRYADDYGYATVGDLLADTALRSLNEDLQANELDPLRQRFITELGLTDEDIIEIPTVFETLEFCGPYVVALTPGTVNLIVANRDGQAPFLAVPDPFFRADGLGPEDDPIAQDFVSRMPAELEVAFIDDWYSYHLLDGEVHCGTNVTRTPLEDWTTAGAELLGLEGGN